MIGAYKYDSHTNLSIEYVGISIVNLSNLKTGKVRAIRFSTLDKIYRELNCQPGDILEYLESADEDEVIEEL
jgi:putative transcriptional regulator